MTEPSDNATSSTRDLEQITSALQRLHDDGDAMVERLATLRVNIAQAVEDHRKPSTASPPKL